MRIALTTRRCLVRIRLQGVRQMEESIDILTESGERFCKLTYSSGKRILHMRGKSVRFDTLAAQVYASEAAKIMMKQQRQGKKPNSSTAGSLT